MGKAKRQEQRFCALIAGKHRRAQVVRLGRVEQRLGARPGHGPLQQLAREVGVEQPLLGAHAD
ncbi:MAG TPA: hypothetical protein PLJ35_11595 [Anaerolineae bacterium]|nr:hypothetical protein [Anaerolineae bacterium]HPL29574.1 hypothetical protein [Anaerolineae bacterium]